MRCMEDATFTMRPLPAERMRHVINNVNVTHSEQHAAATHLVRSRAGSSKLVSRKWPR